MPTQMEHCQFPTEPHASGIYLSPLRGADSDGFVIDLDDLCFRPGQPGVLHPDLGPNRHVTCCRLHKTSMRSPNSEILTHVKTRSMGGEYTIANEYDTIVEFIEYRT